MFIYGTSTSTFPDDGYGVSTDNPPTAFEQLDEIMTKPVEQAIRDGFNQWLEDTAMEYFDTGNWDDEWKTAWRDIVREIV